MANKSDTTIFYQEQVDICKRHFTPEQFGRLMLALFEVEDGNDPEVDDDIAIAFEFMALQKKLDRKKYEEKCRKNRENGKKGGRPPKPKKANGFFQNPNDNDNENDNDNKNDNDTRFHDDFSSFGTFSNVQLTETERAALKQQYERSEELIDKVSLWLRSAKNDVPDHFGLCIKFASNDNWPKKKEYVPPKMPEVQDPLSEEEQALKMSQMRQTLSGMFEA